MTEQAGDPDSMASNPIWRIGVLLCSQKVNLPAAKHLILALNRQQRTFEFEFLPPVHVDGFLDSLSSKGSFSRDTVRSQVEPFLDLYDAVLLERSQSFRLAEKRPPDCYVVISSIRFTDNFYSLRCGRLSIIALGNWKRVLAPPSFLEFAQTILIRQAIGAVSPRLRGSGHLGTKGCLFDFTQSLEDVRHKVLTGFVCRHCREALVEDGLPQLVGELEHVLDKTWLGSPADPMSPAGVTYNLGYDLFITKGLRATPWETFRSYLRREGGSQLLTVVGGVLIAVLLVLLGIKS